MFDEDAGQVARMAETLPLLWTLTQTIVRSQSVISLTRTTGDVSIALEATARSTIAECYSASTQRLSDSTFNLHFGAACKVAGVAAVFSGDVTISAGSDAIGFDAGVTIGSASVFGILSVSREDLSVWHVDAQVADQSAAKTHTVLFDGSGETDGLGRQVSGTLVVGNAGSPGNCTFGVAVARSTVSDLRRLDGACHATAGTVSLLVNFACCAAGPPSGYTKNLMTWTDELSAVDQVSTARSSDRAPDTIVGVAMLGACTEF